MAPALPAHRSSAMPAPGARVSPKVTIPSSSTPSKACGRCQPKAAIRIWTMWKWRVRWSTWPTTPAASSRNRKCQRRRQQPLRLPRLHRNRKNKRPQRPNDKPAFTAGFLLAAQTVCLAVREVAVGEGAHRILMQRDLEGWRRDVETLRQLVGHAQAHAPDGFLAGGAGDQHVRHLGNHLDDFSRRIGGALVEAD